MLDRVYLLVVTVTYVAFAAVFVVLQLQRRRAALQYFALAWLTEAVRLTMHLVDAYGARLSDRWFAVQDLLYLPATVLLLAGTADFVDRALPRRTIAAYLALSVPLILANYAFLRTGGVPAPGWAQEPETFRAVLIEMVVVFVPGAAVRLLAAVWLLDYWRRTALAGALVATVCFALHALGSLSVPVQWYLSYYPPGGYLTWFLEVLGVSVGVLMVALGRHHADLVLAERRHDAFFGGLLDGAVLFDRRQLMVEANALARDRLGLRGRPAASGEESSPSLSDLFADPDSAALVQERLARGEPVKLEARLRARSGGAFAASVAGGVHRGLDGSPAGYFLTFVDITERSLADEDRQRLLDETRQARSHAETASRTKDEFLATLSHELRTPLNAILGWAHLLGLGALDAATTARAVQTIQRNGRLLGQLVADLLDVSRIVAGKLRLDLQRLDLDAVARDVAEAMRPAVESKGLRLVVNAGPGLLPLSADPARVHQILWNLVSNAVKFTAAGGVVEIELQQDGPDARVVVKDTGIGIPPSFLPHMFERFRQADSSTTRTYGGLGLGLALVRHLSELHGGSVEAASAGEGKGATFTVRLPTMPPALPPPPADAASAPPPHGDDH